MTEEQVHRAASPLKTNVYKNQVGNRVQYVNDMIKRSFKAPSCAQTRALSYLYEESDDSVQSTSKLQIIHIIV